MLNGINSQAERNVSRWSCWNVHFIKVTLYIYISSWYICISGSHTHWSYQICWSGCNQIWIVTVRAVSNLVFSRKFGKEESKYINIPFLLMYNGNIILLISKVYFIWRLRVHCDHLKPFQWLLYYPVHSVCALIIDFTEKTHGKLVSFVCEFSNCISDFKKERP